MKFLRHIRLLSYVIMPVFGIALICILFDREQSAPVAQSVMHPAAGGRSLLPGITVEELTETRRAFHVRPMLTLSPEDTMVILGIPGQESKVPVRVWALYKAMYQIPGVTEFIVCPYSFEVSRAKSYVWSEVERDMVKVITKAYPWLVSKEVANAR